MDILYLSPEFPPNYANFVLRLNELGVNVWAMGEADFHFMPEQVRSALTWYVKADLNSRAEVRGALDTLLDVKTSAGGARHFDLVESHNEQWLRLEAFINHTLGIEGITPQDLDRLKKKSVMKEIFRDSGLPVARGQRVEDLEGALALAHDLGYPLILKPDEGVGAGGVHKVVDTAQLRHLWPQLDGDYLMEEFIDAKIVTYDGLTDRSGRICFDSSLVYGDGILDYVLGKDVFFYVNRAMPDRLKQVGSSLVERFGIRRKFFHFEFFVVRDGYMPIEINCRPPGGPILDMMNFSVDDDLYAAYARMVAHGSAEVARHRKYFCCYLGRRDGHYAHGHADILRVFGHRLVDYGENPPLFQNAMGRYRYILRSDSEPEILRMAQFVLQKP
ncbi:MAG: hypothetical protein GXY42_12375 [Desulfovibrionales bacterium]|nr:hypothetical protein [Desulfovibrionales bacterium]